MNSRMRMYKSVSGTEAKFWIPRLLAFGILALGLAGWLIAGEPPVSPGLTVHEWGTFTAIAGKDGRAMEWAPLTGSTDLPEFVEHLSAANFKGGLRGTIRMETPVIYFYSPRDATVSVKASFSQGLITEWYPHASRVEPSGVVRHADLSLLEADGSIAWTDVAISPDVTGVFPREDTQNRYYAARETSSAPLRIQTKTGEQQEKFLFYRGVSASSLPLSAEQNSAGRLLVRNLGQDEIPTLILFERRGNRVGYRLTGALTGETTLEPPALTGSVDELCDSLQEILVNQGLYADEAHAMIETWRDSWFEEGSRLIYMVPRGFVDHILPLTVKPSPGQLVRVFVGRIEIVTPATVQAVKAALASEDEATLNQYRRFLEPIQRIVNEEHTGSTR